MTRASATKAWRNLLLPSRACQTPKNVPRAPVAAPVLASKHLPPRSRRIHTSTRGIASPQALASPRQSHARCFSTPSQALHQHNDNALPVSTSSVSASEVEHFSRLASSWWDPHGPSRLLHLMNPLRWDFLTTLLPPGLSKKYTYLDIGCGGGIFATSCARHPFTKTITAIDPTPACIAVATAHQRTDPALSAPKLTYLNTSLESLPHTQKYDIITLFEVLEHIDQPSAFLANAANLLNPGGWIVGSTIARSPMAYITTKLIAEAPIVGVVPRGTHEWGKYINPGELRGWFEQEGKWEAMVTQGVVYVPALGWRVVEGSEGWGNYFFGVQKKVVEGS